MPYLPCEICKKEVYRKPSHVKGHVYCSNGCARRGRLNGEYRNCAICHEKVYRTRKYLKLNQTGTFLCSKKCCDIWRKEEFREEKHGNWKSGESVYRLILLRSGLEERCYLCYASNKEVLVVHHIDKNRSNNNWIL